MKKHRKKRKPFTSYVDSRVWYFMERRAGDPKRQRAVVASWHKARYEALPEARRRHNKVVRNRNRSLLRKQRKERRAVLMEDFKEERSRELASKQGKRFPLL